MICELLEDESLKPNFLQRLAIKAVTSGPLPKHIGVIMDGNRRWAKQRNLPSFQGHEQGAKTLDMVCHWMEYFDIPEATFYAFSTDNFNRPTHEIEPMMQLFTKLLQRSIDKIDVINKHGVRFKLMGRLELMPPEIQSLAADIMMLTKNNKNRRINLAVAYKSSEEIERAAKSLKRGVDDGHILPSDIDESLFEKCLYTADGYPVDFIIRSSGEQRFSDFFLWQSSSRLFYFFDKFWPDLSFVDIFKALLFFQRHYDRINKFHHTTLNKKSDEYVDDVEKEAKKSRVAMFLFNKNISEIAYLLTLKEQ